MGQLLTLTDRRAKGQGAFIDLDTGRESQHQTLMCAHCQMHWMVRPGSGINRGFCVRCAAPTCGKKKCFERCEPWEARLERMEGRVSLAAAIHRIKSL